MRDRLCAGLHSRNARTAISAGHERVTEGANIYHDRFETQGHFKIELFEKEAPVTVENFLQYVDDGFYDGTIFHRVIPNFMIQGGGFEPRT